MKKKILINIAVGVWIALAVTLLVFTVKGWSIKELLGIKPTIVAEQPKAEEPIVETTEHKDDILTDNKGKASLYMLICYMHEMANTLVIAEDDQRWGFREINEANINIVYDTAMALDDSDSDKARFVAISQRWKNHDFSKIVEEHNTVWALLGGNVGKANGINDKAVKDVLSKLNK